MDCFLGAMDSCNQPYKTQTPLTYSRSAVATLGATSHVMSHVLRAFRTATGPATTKADAVCPVQHHVIVYHVQSAAVKSSHVVTNAQACAARSALPSTVSHALLTANERSVSIYLSSNRLVRLTLTKALLWFLVVVISSPPKLWMATCR